MLANPDTLAAQVLQGASQNALAAYLAFSHSRFEKRTVITARSKGFIARELHFAQDDDWIYSAVLNQHWVLWYFRRPALNSGLIDFDTTLAQFPDAQRTSLNEIKLRVHDVAEARRVLDWVGAIGDR